MKDRVTKESFLSDVKNHKIEILRDDGLYRHIRMANTGRDSWNQWYELITWPGAIAYNGDMGSFMFRRTDDMFDFFRPHNGELGINSGYWAEKCVAESIFGNGIREWSVDAFREQIKDHIRDILDLTDGEEIPEEYLDEVHSLLTAEDEWECVAAYRDFSSELFDLTDFFDGFTSKEKTYHYIWCLFAIVFGVMAYDEAKRRWQHE